MHSSQYIKALQSFLAAARDLSFTHGAADLGVTPGAVSRMVMKLEDYLGQRLFHRSPQGLQLTEVGARLYREVSEPFDDIVAAMDRLRLPAQPNRVNLVCHPTFAARWLLPRWSKFYGRFPDIEVQITTTLTDVDFTSDRSVDIAIQLSPSETNVDAERRSPKARDLQRDHLSEIDIVAVCSPDLFTEENGELGTIAALKQKVLIHAQPLPNEWRNWLNSYARATTSAELREYLETIDCEQGPNFQTLDLAIQAAIEGVGVALAFVDFVADDLTSGRLIAPLPFVRRSHRSFQLLSPSRSINIPAVRRYRDWLLTEAQQNTGASVI